MKAHLCAAILLLMMARVLPAQDSTRIKIPLQLTLRPEPTAKLISILEADPPPFAGIPRGLDTMLYWSFVSSWQQNVFDQYRNGALTESEFLEKKADPKYYTTQNVDYKIFGLSGFRNGKKIVVMDTNHNFDLSDEQVLESDTTLTDIEKMGDDYLLSPWLKTYVDFYESGKIYRISLTGRIDPFVKLFPSPGKLIEDLKFSFYSFEDYRGTVTLGTKKYNVRADRVAGNGMPNELLFSNYGLAADAQEDIFAPIMIGQKIFINGAHYQYEQYDRDSNNLVLIQLPDKQFQDITGGKVGMRAPVYQDKIIGSEDSVYIGGSQKKYQFIHAWGTWCGPCLADHDALIRLQKRYEGQHITFIGLAVDRDLQTVIDYQQKKGLDWKNVFFVRNEAFRAESVLINQFYINAYPTYMIIDPQGIVMARGKLKEMEGELYRIENSR